MLIKRKVYRPYNARISFTLSVYDNGNGIDWRGQTRLSYTLTRRENGKTETIFKGNDFCGSPMHSDDSEETIRSLLGFLTLRPGDTDFEHFSEYTSRQLEFCNKDAETLSMYTIDD